MMLAVPDAREDGADIVGADVRVHAAVEAEPDLVGGEQEEVWACRVTAEGPLPYDYFDRILAEGLAFRLGGLAVCRGEVSDPADESLTAGVILPAPPVEEELRTLLKDLGGDDAEAEPHEEPGEVEPEAKAEPEVEAAQDTVEADEATAAAEEDVESDGDKEEEDAAPVDEAPELKDVYTVGDLTIHLGPERRRLPATEDFLPYATELTLIDVRGDDPLKVGALALRLSDGLNGVVVDRWGFRVDKPEDLLPKGEQA
ncbi:hypothetical protein [Nonomuraea rhizosphaerae]|uniref:hypothetical protein n=1 Tax=Nonomuraea rhizosphaerae TaxID=2665663 RepID=UPI001C5FAC08|nr:hypothetical protein [Nonomuraea rhizosphaerae]